jgi:hypothetical protein
MKNGEENSIDQMLKGLKPIAAPKDFEIKVMQKISVLEQKTENIFLLRLPNYLLAISLGAVAVAIFYLVGIEQIQLIISNFNPLGSGWLQSDMQLFTTVFKTFSHIPVLVFVVGAILVILLILERIILRKISRPSFVFMF